MASSFTPNINLEKPGIGEQDNEWGTTLNNNFDTIDTKLAIKDEDNMASDSATHLATQQSIKAYVDSQSASEEEVEDIVGAMTTSNTETGIAVTYQDADGTLDFVVTDTTVAGDSGSTGITPGDTLTIAGGTNVTTAMSGDTLTVTSTDTNTQLSQEQVEDYVGGMLDGTETFIAVSYDDTDGNIDFVVPVLDEDDMSTNSAAHLATQQSIKAYVDTAASTGTRNLLMNGAMQVSQRGTSEASVTTTQYANAPDRFKVSGNNGTWTVSQDTNAPAGFSTSFKMLLTATETIGGTSYWVVQQYIESQNLQHLAYGTSSAKTVTVSFYVKSNVTGTYCLNLYQESDAGTKNFPKTYTINSADTWEYKTISYVGDTATALDNDNTSGLRTQFFVVAGSTYTSGSAGSRGDYTNGTFAAGQAVQIDAVDDYWQITGLQLEVGTTATDFEHRTYGEELAACQRYLYVLRADTDDKGMGLTGQAYSTTVAIVPIVFPVTPRAKITGIETTGATHFALTVAASSRQESTGVAFGSGGLDGIWLSVTVAANLVAGNAVTLWSANANAKIFFTGAEL